MSKIENSKVSSKDKTTILVNGTIMLSDDDILEIITWYNDNYNGKGWLAREGEHEIVTAEKIALVDPNEYAIVPMAIYNDMASNLSKYLDLFKYRATRSRFWDAFGKTCMVTRLVLVILLLLRVL